MYWDSLFNWAVVQFKVKDGSSGNLNAALYKLISQFSLSVTGTVRVLLNQCKKSQIKICERCTVERRGTFVQCLLLMPPHVRLNHQRMRLVVENREH